MRIDSRSWMTVASGPLPNAGSGRAAPRVRAQDLDHLVVADLAEVVEEAADREEPRWGLEADDPVGQRFDAR